jgi:glycerol-3-phosphate acyltransferase PlsY
MTQAAGWTLGLLGAYLLGSIPFGYLVGRLGGIDIRNWGSKNVGATNVGRILGWRRGVLVLALDTLKGAAAVGLLGRAMSGMVGEDQRGLFLVLAGAAAVVGHTFTCWLRFKGGKGVATALGAWLALAWLPTLIALAVWGVAVVIWRYVSLASIIAAVALPAALVALRWDRLHDSTPEVVFAGLLAALVVVRHAGNIVRICRGTESRITQLFVKQIRAPKPKS